MTDNRTATITARLLEHCADIELSLVPSRVIERAKDLLLDHIGVALYGSTLPWGRIARTQAEAEGGRPESTIYAGIRAPARAAALVNGTACHGSGLDDTHDESLSHPGSVVIPAALAVAEKAGASGRTFLSGMIAGYEAQCRVGAALGAALMKCGFHPMAHLGVFGATAAAGRVLGLSPAHFSSAFGIATSRASGVMKFTQDPEGTMVKRLHAGLAAESGVLAAELAALGLTGPRDALEGPYGFAELFAGGEDLSGIMRGAGEEFGVERISVKLYPCCRLFHALLEAVEECRRQPGFVADDIVEILAMGPQKMFDGHLERRPLSEVSAQYSLPYTVALAAIADATVPASYSGAAMLEPALLALGDKVVPELSPELEELYPKKFAGRVVFKMKNGAIFESTMLDSKGTPAKPVGRTDIQARFRAITSDVLTLPQQEQIIDVVFNVDQLKDIASLNALLGNRTDGSPKRDTYLLGA